MENKISCSERIKAALIMRDMTQADLCRLTGIPKSAMSQYCNGSLVPRQNRTHAIAQALNVSEAWLMGFDVSIQPEKAKVPLTIEDKGELMSALDYIGALDENGNLSDKGVRIVAELLRNNADMLKKLMDDVD